MLKVIKIICENYSSYKLTPLKLKLIAITN